MTPRLGRGCRLSPNGDALLFPEGALRLQGPAAAILKLCDGGRTIDDIATELVAQFAGSNRQTVLQETTEFLNKLAGLGVIEFV